MTNRDPDDRTVGMNAIEDHIMSNADLPEDRPNQDLPGMWQMSDFVDDGPDDRPHIPKRLWEVEHPYYCSESNYYSNDPGERYESWAEFHQAWDSYDLDLNLLFRWDWRIEEYEGEERPKGTQTLQLFYILQRKGIFMCIEVEVTPEDEPQIRQWLQVRWDKMLELWRPLS